MIIQHNLAGLNAKRNQKINESKLKKNLEKLTSGYKINTAGDDAAGLAISEQLRFSINGLDQAQDNIGDAINMIQTAEGALQEVHAMLNRMYECSVSSSNGTYNEASREAMEEEVQELKEEISRIAEDTNFYFVPLVNSPGTNDAQYQIGAEKEEVLEIDLPGTNDAQYQIGAEKEEVLEIDLPGIKIGEDALDIEDVSVITQEKANASIPLIKDAIGFISAERGRVGAYQNRLEHTEQSIGVTHENLVNAESRIRDTDMAEEITNYTKDNIIYQAAQSMLTQANASAESVLGMIQ